MLQGKPKRPRPEQQAELNKALLELKRRLKTFSKQVNNLPELELQPTWHTDDVFRKTLLDDRAALGEMITTLGIMKTCIQDVSSIWPEGRQPLSLLLDATKLGAKLGDNLMEENLLWDRSKPLDNYSQNRRRKIFTENRKLGPEADRKFIEASRLIFELTNFNLID